MSLKELPLPSIASLRAIAALRSPYLSLVRPARIGLGFEAAGAPQKTLAEVETILGGVGRLSLPYSLCWLLDVLSGLGVLHRTLGFVHGEVQPEHIVLGDDGVGRVVPVVRPHWVRGESRSADRLYYLAPEKLLGDRVDVRSDVFSVGVLLWEALMGQPLVAAREVDSIIARLMSGAIPRAHAVEGDAWTEPLGAIAERAISVDPGKRFASVAEMRDALHAASSRYLASPPGMAQLFQNPEARARSPLRDSLPPDSQRITQPPRMTFPSVDLEEETTAKSSVSVPPREVTAAASPPRHVSTLIGVASPLLDRESSPDAITEPFSKIPPSVPVLITPLPSVPAKPAVTRRSTPAGPPSHLERVSAPPLSAPPPFVPPSSVPPSSVPRASSSVPPVAVPPTAASSAPPARLPSRAATMAGGLIPAPSSLPAAQPPSTHAFDVSPASPRPLVAPAPSMTLPEPSFELVRPRRRRAALWVVLGAAAAAGLFAVRPWLEQQLSTDAAAISGTSASDLSATTEVTPSTASGGAGVTPTPAAEPPRVVGIASVPAAPPARHTRGRSAREEHVVIHDRVEPEPAPSRAVEQTPEPVAPPAPVAPPPAPAPEPKPKQVPVSDADRYGI